MEDTHLSDVPPHCLTDKHILTLIQMHISSRFPDILPAFMAAVTSPSHRLYYSGTLIQLKRKNNEHVLLMKSLRCTVHHDFPGTSLNQNNLQIALTTSWAVSDSSEDDDEDAEGEEDGSSPLSLPSSFDLCMPPPLHPPHHLPSVAHPLQHRHRASHPSSSHPKKHAK
jgi:hypothetical protein